MALFSAAVTYVCLVMSREEFMDAKFHGGWTAGEEIHSSSREWNTATGAPLVVPIAPRPPRSAPVKLQG